MKKIIVIGSYPSNKEREEVLLECINRLSNKGYDLMVVSHYPVPDYIQAKVNYCIYDKENTFLPSNLTPSYWYGTNQCHVEIYNEGHFITCSKNMFNALSLINALKYDFFYYMESDNYIDSEDVIKMDELKDNMFQQNKNMVLFKQEADGYMTYNTLLFGGRPNYFINNVPLPLNVDDYVENLNIFRTSDTIERFFYASLSKDENNFVIIEEDISFFFSKSKINIISHEHFAEVIGDDKGENLFLWISNDYANPIPVTVRIDGGEPVTMVGGNWFYSPKNVGDKFEVEVEENGFVHRRTFEITEENRDKYFKKGKITFR